MPKRRIQFSFMAEEEHEPSQPSDQINESILHKNLICSFRNFLNSVLAVNRISVHVPARTVSYERAPCCDVSSTQERQLCNFIMISKDILEICDLPLCGGRTVLGRLVYVMMGLLSSKQQVSTCLYEEDALIRQILGLQIHTKLELSRNQTNTYCTAL